MALGWLTLLRSVPWAGVISSAPLVADGARQLWKAVSKEPSSSLPSSHPRAHFDPADTASLESLKARVAALETGHEALHAQMLKSSELIQALADQNTQLIARAEVGRIRVLWLTGLAVAAVIVAIGTLAVAIAL